MADNARIWLKQSLDYVFKDARLLELALTHRSAEGDSNERLEFLGDAVLDFVVSEVLFRSHPNSPEGDLSRLRASLVNEQALAGIAGELGLSDYLRLGSGERKSGVHRRDSILADALEAIFAAVYLDAGFDAARRIVEKAYGSRFEEFPDVEELRDPKTRLQEWMQARQLGLPDYELLDVTGKAHRQTFRASCQVGDRVTTGTGSTRRNAEQQAAESMLAQLHGSETS